MSKLNELIAIYKLDFYKRQKNWRLGNQKSKSSRKAATEINNRPKLNKTYTVNAEPPEAAKEEAKLDDAFLDSGNKEENVSVQDNENEEEITPEPAAEEQEPMDLNNNTEQTVHNENYLQNLIKTDAIIRDKLEKHEHLQQMQNLDPKQENNDQPDWIQAAMIWTQNIGIQNEEMNQWFNEWSQEETPNSDLPKTWSQKENPYLEQTRTWSQNGITNLEQPETWTQNEAPALEPRKPWSQNGYSNLEHLTTWKNGIPDSEHLQTWSQNGTPNLEHPTSWSQKEANEMKEKEMRKYLSELDVCDVNYHNLPDFNVNHGNVEQWLVPNGGWAQEEQKGDNYWTTDICEDMVDGVDWSSEAEAALHEADDFLKRNLTSGQMSHWSSLDSEVFMRGAAAAPHSSESDLASTFRSNSPCGSLQSLVSRQARVLRSLLHQARAEEMSQKHNSTKSLENSPSFEYPTRDVGPNTPTPSLVRQVTFTRRPTLAGTLDKDSSFIRGSFRDLEGFEGGRGRGRVVLRGGRPYRMF